MTVDRFTQIFYMVWKAAEDALDLTRNLRYARDSFDDGAEEAAIETLPEVRLPTSASLEFHD